MLVPVDGGNFGAVTAGCLEKPVIDLATGIIETGTPRLEVFDMIESDDDSWGLGLGCNGIIDLFIEPLDASVDRPLATLADGDPVTVVTVVESTDEAIVGNRVVTGNGENCRDVPDREAIPTAVLDAVSATVDRLHGTGETRTTEVEVDGTTVTVLTDSMLPSAELLLFGSQNDLPPLANLAADVGFRVTVHSPRGAVDDGTFPGADTVTTGHPSSTIELPWRPCCRRRPCRTSGSWDRAPGSRTSASRWPATGWSSRSRHSTACRHRSDSTWAVVSRLRSLSVS
jgi:xanthine dehydrogenase accessory factor